MSLALVGTSIAVVLVMGSLAAGASSASCAEQTEHGVRPPTETVSTLELQVQGATEAQSPVVSLEVGEDKVLPFNKINLPAGHYRWALRVNGKAQGLGKLLIP